MLASDNADYDGLLAHGRKALVNLHGGVQEALRFVALDA